MTALAPLLWINGLEARDVGVACAEHEAIVEAVIAQDCALARSLAEDHVQETLDGLIELRMQLGKKSEPS